MMNSRYRPLVPALIMAICCISTLIFWLKGTTNEAGAPVDYVLNAKHYGAFVATGATLASFFFLRRYFKYFFALTFLLGVLGLINFTLSEVNFYIAFGSLQIGSSPTLAIIGLVTFFLYPKRITTKLSALIKPSEEKIARAQQEEIAAFKERFSKKTAEELSQIVMANALVPSALIAARELLRESK
ncbi:hypothetical protein Q5H92_23115 [Hymenobacter sp. M29]|uniref:DUF4199 domain-containing protein n=1 Tax=Hymenobacter mellowenesis TaxID=3063995 RepID=A0ABT9AI80_9BACT|nr:hypothetical protein [Hymenobacter sp. M29]MDO7849273.1 hypothetical protein [Hymenobacter sp. M29]